MPEIVALARNAPLPARPPAGDACRLYPFDVPANAGEPKAGDYIVSVGARGVGSVYQVIRATRTGARPPAPDQVRWRLDCLRAPDMREKAIFMHGRAVIPGETVWSMHWYAREGRKGRA